MSNTATPTLEPPRNNGVTNAWQFHTPIRARHKGAVRAGMGDLDARLDGREVVTFIIDSTERRGALSEGDGQVIAAAAHMAREMRRPLIGVLSSSGADILGGIAALHGWGTAAKAVSDCSGLVPVIFVVDGPAVSGVALLLGLADIVIMTESSYAFVSGPSMVADFTGIHVDNESLGGTATHAKRTGLPSFVTGSLDEALDRVAEVLAYLPDHVDTEATFRFTDDPTERDAPELDDIIPATSTGSYDVRNVAREIADEGRFARLKFDGEE